ncbi:SiaB family protein kinase [Crocinitomix catalasitica]|uniref:SiaB family protein kinase n=1 Tax=Crocinitomix catalasitica TaxID=184607 RepID=UPI00047FB37E|nr:SiaB family protein kinase [Crocinitomix catalasitica]
MLQKNTLLEKCSARFQKIFGDYNVHADGKIIVSHFGEFSQDLVNSLSTNIEEIMLDSGDKKGVLKKVFSILVEGLQNIRIHGERDENKQQISFLIVLQKDEDYKVTFGNLVKKSNIDKIEARIDKLNKMDRAEIKSLYMDTLSNGVMSNKGGAGLGFITMALKSQNQIKYLEEEVSEDLLIFSQTITVNRE